MVHNPEPLGTQLITYAHTLREAAGASSVLLHRDVLERTIIITFYVTGIRLSELIGLDDKDIDNVTCEIKVTGKRNKQRIV